MNVSQGIEQCDTTFAAATLELWGNIQVHAIDVMAYWEKWKYETCAECKRRPMAQNGLGTRVVDPKLVVAGRR